MPFIGANQVEAKYRQSETLCLHQAPAINRAIYGTKTETYENVLTSASPASYCYDRLYR